jgi:hypothetical protein
MSRVVNIVDDTRTTNPPSEVLPAVVAALQAQVDAFCADWSLADDVVVSAGGRHPKSTTVMPLHLVDDAPGPGGVLGYHDATPKGTPEAFVFVGPILANGGTWTDGPNSVSVCMSHELLEMLLDLEANEYVNDHAGRMWAREACDAVEARSIVVAGCALSDYVLPAYFTPGAHGPFDKLGALTAPFSVDRGGYAIVSKSEKPSQVFGAVDMVPDAHGDLAIALGSGYPAWKHASKAAAASRTMRRLAATASVAAAFVSS